MTDNRTYSGEPETADIVEAEALAWIAQLNGDDVTEKDLAAFREWVQRSPAHQKEIIELGAVWEDLNILTTMDEPIYAADKLSKKLRQEQSRKVWRRRLIIPAGLAAMAMAIFSVSLIQPQISQAPSTEIVQNNVTVPVIYKSKIGEQQTHQLQDGSIITLNTNSLVEVSYTDMQRNIRLLNGEALFTVEKDTSRPFLVFANDGVIRAVGTEFSVRLHPSKVDLIVSEGLVEISTFSPAKTSPNITSTNGEPLKMASLGKVEAGQSAEIKNQIATIEIISQADMSSGHSWRDGYLRMQGAPLEDIIAEMNRYTERQIYIDDPDLLDMRLTASFKLSEADIFLRNLPALHGIDVKIGQDNSMRLSRR